MKIDAVFSGGGVKAFTFIGALKSIENRGFKISRVAGTSSGAIISSLIAAKYSAEEIEEMLLSLPLQAFLDPPNYTRLVPFSKWYNLFFRMGFFKGNKLENWLERVLANKNIYTFKDLKKDYLKIIVSDLTKNRLVVLPDDLEEVYGIRPEDFSIARAVRISAGYPLFFMPVNIQNSKEKNYSLLVDGGIVSNFPLWLFKNKSRRIKRPTLGLNIINKNEHKKIRNTIDLLHAIIKTMKQSFDERVIDQSIKDIIFLKVESIETMNLSITKQEKLAMIKQGKRIAEKFLSNWPK